MFHTEPEFSERKVLHMAACQGFFKINRSSSSFEKKQEIVTELVLNKYLKHVSLDGLVATYEITDTGKEHLKVLSGQKPKHKPEKKLPIEELSLEYVITKRLHTLKSANRRGLDFNLTDANVRKLLKSPTCYYTGVVFGEDSDPLNVRTFERIDDNKGYIHGNVVAVTLRANRIKNLLLESDNELKLTTEQFIMMAEKLKKHTLN